jgi:soluble lytic murein transglycosylase-like protein
MRSPSPARRRSPRVAGMAGPMAERRHTGSRRLPCSALLLLAFAGALGAHAAEMTRPADADLRAGALPAATGGAAALEVPLAAAMPAAKTAAEPPLAGEPAPAASLAPAPGAASPPPLVVAIAASASPGSGPAVAGEAGLAAAPTPAPAPPPAAAPAPAPKPHPALGFDAAAGVPARPFGKLIYQIARSYALNPLLVAAIAKVESDFNPRARSRKGAYGLMQVLPSTARRFGLPRKRDLYNPRKNLETASRYLRWLVDRFGDDPVRVLAAYNAGEGAVDRFGGVPPFSETRDYVQRIFGLLGFSVLLDAPAAAPVAAAAAALAGVAGAR